MWFSCARASASSFLCLSVAAPQRAPRTLRNPLPTRPRPAVRKWMHSMSLRDKVAQLIIMPIYAEPRQHALGDVPEVSAPRPRSARGRRDRHWLFAQRRH